MTFNKWIMLLTGFIFIYSGLDAQTMNKNRAKGGMPAPIKSGQMEEPCGLTPVFPANLKCTGISSPYGSRTRYDGSLRPDTRFGGRHGGIDLTLEPGTPLLAIASGILMHKGEGDQMEGIFLYLLHSPEETGLEDWMITKYQHLQLLPEIETGKRVLAGEVIAFSGKTGTSDGHYGAAGYPHLHLSVMKNLSGKPDDTTDKSIIKNTILTDPLLLFKHAHTKTASEGQVLIPYKKINGEIWPKGSLAVWPVACE